MSKKMLLNELVEDYKYLKSVELDESSKEKGDYCGTIDGTYFVVQNGVRYRSHTIFIYGTVITVPFKLIILIKLIIFN